MPWADSRKARGFLGGKEWGVGEGLIPTWLWVEGFYPLFFPPFSLLSFLISPGSLVPHQSIPWSLKQNHRIFPHHLNLSKTKQTPFWICHTSAKEDVKTPILAFLVPWQHVWDSLKTCSQLKSSGETAHLLVLFYKSTTHMSQTIRGLKQAPPLSCCHLLF